MLHDPEIYREPMKSKPERYNGDDAEMEKVKDLVFGFSRCFCLGRYFSGGTTFAMIATTLATCDIFPGLDENGDEVLPKVAYTPGTIV
jgi:cytochrome P450